MCPWPTWRTRRRRRRSRTSCRLRSSRSDLANNALPNYSFVTPNGCDDAHDCSIQTFDNWLKTNIAPLLSNSQFLQNGVLIVPWDESANDNTNGGGRVQFVLAGPTVKTAYSSSTLYQWPSLCRLSLEGLDVPTIPAACASAPSMLEFFVNTAPPPPTTVSLSATSLAFPSQIINTTSAAQTVTLTNTGTALLNITSIVPSGDYAQTTTCGTSVAAGGQLHHQCDIHAHGHRQPARHDYGHG